MQTLEPAAITNHQHGERWHFDKETALKLQRGEILDDGMGLDEIMSNTETEELADLEK